ncbi:MAG: CoA transferase [Betaproteobacteria bacterium]|nr:MAG: CoA transferase [Betaproteobacteria bacterium]
MSQRHLADQPTKKSPAGALDGLRVVDVSRFIAGPYCAMLLGDMGADVIKVEPPGRGENSRSYGPFVDGESLYTMVFNRNKRSLTLDLRSDQGKQLMRDLLREADVLVENFVPGTLEKMGFDEETLKTLNPRLVVTRISGFGQSGPLSNKPCFDVIGQTMSGLMEITGDPDSHPTMAGTYVVDYSTGMYATIGTLGALQARERSGEGQVVDVALMDSALSMLMTAIPEQVLHGRSMTRHGNRDRYAAPSNTFPTRDGDWVHLVCASDVMFRGLAKAMGRSGLAEDPRYEKNQARMHNVDELEELITAWTKSLGTEELLAALRDNGVPSAKVASVSDLIEDEHLEHRGQIIRMQHPRVGTVPMQGFSVKFADSPMQLRHPPPLLGQHSDEILNGWLNMNDAQIAQLRKDKII